MRHINDEFDKIYCINLKHRTDRWENCLEQFQKYDINVSRFDAINGKNIIPSGKNGLLAGEIGIIRSNYKIIEEAKNNNYEKIIIFEDDVVLTNDFTVKFSQYYDNTPKDWCFIYMGGNHIHKPVAINERIHRMRYSYAIHAICIHEKMYDIILNLLKKELEQVDVTYAKLQRLHPSYVFIPHLAWQKEGHSDIQGGYVNYNFLK